MLQYVPYPGVQVNMHSENVIHKLSIIWCDDGSLSSSYALKRNFIVGLCDTITFIIADDGLKYTPIAVKQHHMSIGAS